MGLFNWFGRVQETPRVPLAQLDHIRALFLCECDPYDPKAWSGTSLRMRETYESIFSELHCVEMPHPGKVLQTVPKKLKTIGKLATRAVREHDVDLVICQGTAPVPHMNTNRPIVFWHDATWSGLWSGHYGDPLTFEEFRRTKPHEHHWDELALQRADLAVFSSRWAAELAQTHYGTPAEKTPVIELGANLPGLSDEGAVQSAVTSRSRERCNLLFLGAEHVRKGLDKAIELAEGLAEVGIDARLRVVGSQPDITSDRVEIIGFLDKTVPAELEQLMALLRESHFLVHPASFEAFGIALAEANAYGVPILASNVTGLSTVVADGRNGYLYDLQDFVPGATARVQELWSYPAGYQDLAMSSYREYRTRLNWTTAGERFLEAVRRL